MTNHGLDTEALTEAIRQAGKEYGIDYELLSDGWVIKLTRGDQTHFIEAHEFDINNQASADIATDKVATYQLLAEKGISAVPHFFLSTELDRKPNRAHLKRLFKDYGSLVIKPIKGRKGSLVAKFEDEAKALEHIGQAPELGWTASPYLDIKNEIRLVVFDGLVKLAYEKTKPSKRRGLKMYNLSQGAVPHKLDSGTIRGNGIEDLAKKSMQAIGLRLGGVDVVLSSQKVFYVLEINSGFTLEHYAGHSSKNMKEAVDFYAEVIKSAFGITAA